MSGNDDRTADKNQNAPQETDQNMDENTMDQNTGKTAPAPESGLGISLDEVLEESAADVMSASDLDGDGEVDQIVLDLDKDGYIDTIVTDIDGDGEVDSIQFDTTDDAVLDTTLSSKEEVDAFMDGHGPGAPDAAAPPAAAPAPAPEQTSDAGQVSNTDAGEYDVYGQVTGPDGTIDLDAAEVVAATDTTGDGVVDTLSLDLDGDGIVDAEMREPVGDGFSELHVDTSGDGRIDHIWSDSDGDGNIDTLEIDRDLDGYTDIRYTDVDGDGIVDNVEEDPNYSGGDPVDPSAGAGSLDA
ncbi:hypothetical protein CJ204_07925 [Corynebacterium xerosis]|uniref:EF-hand domain-containing protein n=1 Tax=Corynebacterium xerosis TaxID=1725 RepID=A0A2N6SY36_9CORY|nr:hypothetical protein [Corynebacterium xerosis]PMC61985.1 hypothetical protein CJ204_07925 [Corynebacterium xerosis]